MNYPPIGLTGNLRAGKSVVSAYLRDKYGYTEFAFGDELKCDFHLRYPEIPREPKPRKAYQTHGQLMRGYLSENVWLDACFTYIDLAEIEHMCDEEPFRPVIGDIRQLNEYERCRAEGYVIIRVKARSALRIHRAVESADTFNLADLTHETEQHTDGFAVDYELTNDGTIDELYAQIDEIMRKITEVVRD